MCVGRAKRESEREGDAEGLAEGGEIESARKRVSSGWWRVVDGGRVMHQRIDIQSQERRGPIVPFTQIEQPLTNFESMEPVRRDAKQNMCAASTCQGQGCVAGLGASHVPPSN